MNSSATYCCCSHTCQWWVLFLEYFLSKYLEEWIVQQLTAVAVILVNGEYFLFNVFFQSNYKEINIRFRTRFSPEEMSRVVRMLECGVSQRRVARILNASKSVISRKWKRHLTHEDPSHRRGGGRDRATTQRHDRFLVFQSRRQRFPNASSLNNEFRHGTGVRISTQTVRNRLHEFGLNARRPAIRVPLTRQHVQDM